MLGLDKGEVRLAPPTHHWKELFHQEKKILEQHIGEYVIDIQQFGSTAIDNIKAKPIIDILVGVEEIGQVDAFDKKALKRDDYYHLPGVQIEGKVVFAKFSDLERLTKTHILHVVEYEGDWWKKHLAFRDYPNGHADTAKEYEQLKTKLAHDFSDEEKSYTNGKVRFVEEVLRAALLDKAD
ncbi:GrpB family protein [Guptibacillus algicola]|uniref:GrpB family protein n=1 Tax=Guptibacillus algicola TaxID=225844 RepID=UPI001CD2BC23|nr:GrpB family protein [Alkalihalobacillus algicola]MCA0987138.1 GrpB family protein [Alkalihalobacillus algicola]